MINSDQVETRPVRAMAVQEKDLDLVIKDKTDAYYITIVQFVVEMENQTICNNLF